MMSQSVFHAHYWRDCARLTTQKLCVMGVLMAMQIILSRITAINAIAGYLLGPIGGTLVAWGSDALGTILTGQAINPGLSVTAALGGFFYGLMLHKRPVTIWRTMACLLVVSLVCHFLLNTYFLAMAGFTAVSDGADYPAFVRELVRPIYGEGATMPAWISVCNRFIKQVVVYPVNVAMLLLMLRGVQRMPNAVTHL